MEQAKILVRSVMRAFYETRHILIIDALIRHHALRDDDLAYLMSMNTKDLHKLCGKLREDRCLAVHTRSELREGLQRPINRIYYYIDYRQTIDAIKWRVYKIDKDMQGTSVPASEKKEYFCNRCHAEWTQMEVLDNYGPQGFLCHRCGALLTHDVERHSTGHQQSTRMNNQFKFITDLLPKIDSMIVPDNDFDVAFAMKVEVKRDATHQVASSIGVDHLNRPTAVKGLENTGPTTLLVDLRDSSAPTAEELAAERERKAKIANQNALPSWMAKSTVNGEAFKVNDTSPGFAKTEADGTKNPIVKAKTDAKEDAAIDDYFARLKQQQADEAQRRAMKGGDESSEEEDEDEEGDFEDVVATEANNSAGGTPASTAASGPAPATAPPVPSPLRQSSLKREASNGPSTGANNSPRGGGNTPGSDGRPAKKVKLEEPPVVVIDGESDEDDVEFEDV